MKTVQVKITLPQLEYLVDILGCTQDCGPAGGGWASSKLEELRILFKDAQDKTEMTDLSSVDLGPLPEEQCLWGQDSIHGYEAEDMKKERQRCYALGFSDGSAASRFGKDLPKPTINPLTCPGQLLHPGEHPEDMAGKVCIGRL